MYRLNENQDVLKSMINITYKWGGLDIYESVE